MSNKFNNNLLFLFIEKIFLHLFYLTKPNQAWCQWKFNLKEFIYKQNLCFWWIKISAQTVCYEEFNWCDVVRSSFHDKLTFSCWSNFTQQVAFNKKKTFFLQKCTWCFKILLCCNLFATQKYVCHLFNLLHSGCGQRIMH